MDLDGVYLGDSVVGPARSRRQKVKAPAGIPVLQVLGEGDDQVAVVLAGNVPGNAGDRIGQAGKLPIEVGRQQAEIGRSHV